MAFLTGKQSFGGGGRYVGPRVDGKRPRSQGFSSRAVGPALASGDPRCVNVPLSTGFCRDPGGCGSTVGGVRPFRGPFTRSGIPRSLPRLEGCLLRQG